MRYIDNLRPGYSICGPFLVRDAPGVIVEFVNWSLEIRVNGAPTDDCWELLSADTRGLREALATEVTERQRLEKQVTELQAEGTRLTLENRELARTAKAEKDDFEHQLIDSQERASHLSEQLKERTKQRDCALKQAAESQDALDNVAAEYREFRKNPKRPDQIRIGCRGSGAHISRIDLNTDRWHRFMATADVTGAGIDARISFCDIGTAEQFKKEICRNVAAIVIELA